jgi:hypothetical protein
MEAAGAPTLLAGRVSSTRTGIDRRETASAAPAGT